MTTIHSSPQGPYVERKVGCGSYTAVCREYPLHVAAIRSVREQRAIGEGILPWVRGAGGRFVARQVRP